MGFLLRIFVYVSVTHMYNALHLQFIANVAALQVETLTKLFVLEHCLLLQVLCKPMHVWAEILKKVSNDPLHALIF